LPAPGVPRADDAARADQPPRLYTFDGQQRVAGSCPRCGVKPDAENPLGAGGVCRWCHEELEHTPAELARMRADGVMLPSLLAEIDQAMKKAARQGRRWKPGDPAYEHWKEKQNHDDDTGTH
jgi:hypothetical protein